MKEPMHLAVDRYRTACGVERKGKRSTRSRGVVDCGACNIATTLGEINAILARAGAQQAHVHSGLPPQLESWEEDKPES